MHLKWLDFRRPYKYFKESATVTSMAMGGICAVKRVKASGVVVCLNPEPLNLRLQRILQRAREGQVARGLSEAPRAPADRGGPARLPRLDHAGRGPGERPHRQHRAAAPRVHPEAVHTTGGEQRGRSGGSQRDWLRQRFRCCGTVDKVARWPKFDPFLSLDCARVEGAWGRNPRKGRDQILQHSAAEP